MDRCEYLHQYGRCRRNAKMTVDKERLCTQHGRLMGKMHAHLAEVMAHSRV